MSRIVTILLAVGLLSFGYPGMVRAASLLFSPSTGTFAVGKTFDVTVQVNAEGTPINAAEATVVFPSDRLFLTSVSRSSSIFTFWSTDPGGSNSTGRVEFSGGLPSPGYAGTAGSAVTMAFRVMAPGTAQLTMSDAHVFANDGQGTNVLTGTGSAAFTLTAASTNSPGLSESPAGPTPLISSSTHPNENAWYTATEAKFTILRPAGLLGVSYVLSGQPDTAPDELPEASNGTMTLSILEDGIWYLHVRGSYAGGWSAVDHYRIQIDTTPPEPFSIELVRDRGESDPTPEVRFVTTDALSGIDRYQVTHNSLDRTDVTSPTTLEILAAGEQRIQVTASDAAGNQRSASLNFLASGYPPPTITSVTRRLILLERLTVRGTSQAGDVVVVYVDGEEIGRITVGSGSAAADNVIVRLPWNFTPDRIFGPGSHQVTAVAIGPNQQPSSTTDPTPFTVSATAISLGRKTIATVAAVPAVVIIVLVLLALNLGVIGRLIFQLRINQRRDAVVDAELHALQHQVMKKNVSLREVESTIEQIETDLERPARRRRSSRAQRS